MQLVRRYSRILRGYVGDVTILKYVMRGNFVERCTILKENARKKPKI